MADIILPRMDEDYDESSVIFWHKQEGDSIQKGDILVEVQTEKAVQELEAETDGVLEKIVVVRGEVAAIGDVLGVISEGGTDTSNAEVTSETSETPVAATAEAERRERSFVRVAPRLRRLAKDLNVDLTKIQGTGNGDKITEKDIRTAAEVGSSTVGEKLTGIRRTIASRMKESLQNSAQLTETAYADVTKLADFRDNYEKKISWNSWILYATVKALQEHPYMNGTFEGNMWKTSKKIHLGVAADAEDGLYVPVVKNADNYKPVDLDHEVKALVQAVHTKKIDSQQLSGSTFTVTNLGGYGIHFFTPIINPPEVGILGVGKIETYLALEDGSVIERMRLPLSLTFDHQIIDGAPAARFLQTLITYLEEMPKKMV
ncbi:dihydrolipoamide acetyltransferase family protein [Virgibacillus sp. W0181]|uniref:dihydrolipoamide acetyltransferase family protein n=1 Tax=Virgibacillus sp. W0181 TaxID=3391581 RepID=UPI003F474D53